MRTDKPIIESPLDTDIYKYTMGQFVFLCYPNVTVRYAFKNRTKGIKLGKFIDIGRLREELDHVKTLTYSNSDLHYLRGTNEYQERMFTEPYLEFLKGLKLPDYNLEVVDSEIKLEFSGKWPESIYWEVPALSIVNELYTSAVTAPLSRFEKELVYANGKRRLAEKIKELRKRSNSITFVDFGTRRRFNRDWQRYVIGVLIEELPNQFRGTSNVKFAMDMGLVPMGTSAHELNMVMTAITDGSDGEIRLSQQKLLQDWWDQYGWGLSIILPDTYGSKFTFDTVTAEQARDWKGFRHDSGPPQRFAKWAMEFYKKHNVDAKEKLLIFSDGLRIETMIGVADYIDYRIRYTFGWGTNLMNDLDINPVSIVVKPIEANGIGLVKLSDNLAKAIGRSEDIEEAKRIFGYDGGVYKECEY